MTLSCSHGFFTNKTSFKFKKDVACQLSLLRPKFEDNVDIQNTSFNSRKSNVLRVYVYLLIP